MRYCQNCGDQFEGRANKVFCSTICKSQHFRANSAPMPVAEVPRRPMVPAPAAPSSACAVVRPVPATARPVPVPMEEEDEELDLGAIIERSVAEYNQRKIQEAERRVQAAQAVREELHGRYSDAVQQFLKLSCRLVKVKEVRRVLLVVEAVSVAYAGHPEAGDDDTAPAVRAEWLEDMALELREVLDKARPRANFWGKKENAPASIEVEFEEEFEEELLDSLNDAH